MTLPKKRILLLLVWFLSLYSATAWEWSDFVSTGTAVGSASDRSITLTIQEVSELRARDIKRRLTRHHGYSAEEVAKILDKKELIHALAFEEEKLRLANEENMKRALVKQGIIVSVLAVAVVLCWPLLHHAYEVASVNFVVYTDRKRHEASRCRELKSVWGFIGIAAMFIMDMLQVWLTGSIVLSWVMRSRYFFPVPSLSIKPAQFMGAEVANSSIGGYGINIGPMVIGWVMRFVYAKLEAWTGRALVRSGQKQKQAARDAETPEEKATRRKLRKEQKRATQEQVSAAAARQAAAFGMQPGQQPQQQQPQQPPPYSTEPVPGSAPSAGPEPVRASSAHDDFMEQLQAHGIEPDEFDEARASVMEELD